MTNENLGADLYHTVSHLDVSEAPPPTSAISTPRGVQLTHRIRKAITPAVLAATVAFGTCVVAMATQPKLRKFLTYIWDGDVEQRKLRKRIATANRDMSSRIAKCQSATKKLLANLEALQGDLKKWQQLAAREDELAASDLNHQKHSGYYHFASTGTKYVNKWDTFDADEEIKKIEEEEEGSYGRKRVPNKPRKGPSLDILTKRAREYAVEARNLLDKKLDCITHEMANQPDLFGESKKLKKRRQHVVKRLNRKLLPLALEMVKRIKTVREERQKQLSESGGAAASAGSPRSPSAQPEPTLLSPDDLDDKAGSQTEAAQQASVAGSAWNKDNRQYEEKDVKAWATQRLEALLQATTVTTESGVVVRIQKVTKSSAMATITSTSRGPGVVFSFEQVECAWAKDATDDDATEASGTLTIADVDVCDVSDSELSEPLTLTASVTAGDASILSQLKRAASTQLKLCFRDLLEALEAEFIPK